MVKYIRYPGGSRNMDREELEKKIEVTKELLDSLYALHKMLKKGSGLTAGMVLTANYADKVNAQIRQLKAPFKKYGKSEISDTKGDTVISSKEIVLLRELQQYDMMTRGRHLKNYTQLKDNILELIPVYESLIEKTEIIRDELMLLKGKAETSKG